MWHEALMARIRTFIAVEVGDAIRGAAVALQQRLARAGAKVKWAAPETMHVTLLFLGEVDERDLHAVCRAVGAACASVPAFPMTVEGVGSFGNPKRPRTLWAGVGAGREELIALHAAIEARLLGLGAYRREERGFTPHITLGRVRGEGGAALLAESMRKQEKWIGGECEVGEAAVMSSELRSEGPVYALLSRAPLG
jgi:2'-5' RNA ligase